MSQKQIHVNFNYQNQYTKEVTATVPSPIEYANLEQSYKKSNNLYEPQSFKSLKIQSKQIVSQSKQVPVLNSSPPKVFQSKYNLPHVCQSLHKQQCLQDQLELLPQNKQGQIPLLQGGKQGEYKKSKDQPKQYQIVQLPQQKQSQFKGCCGCGTINEKIIFQSKSQNVIKQKQSEVKSLNKNPQIVEQLNSSKKEPQVKTLNKARGEVKTFVIQKLPEQKESDFVGCCGFGTSKKVAYSN